MCPLDNHAHSRRKARGLRGWLELVLLGLGLFLLSYSGYMWVEAQLYQAMENRELDALLASSSLPTATDPATEPGAASDSPPAYDGGDVTPPPRMRPRPGSLIGRIEIPRLDVSAVIRAGSDSRTLQLAVGHIPGTALPGEMGNIGLAAHRDTFFRRLRDIRGADEIRLVTRDGTYAFRVERTLVVDPSDVWVLEGTGAPALTLVTCYPFTYIGTAPRRFIVRARAVDGLPADGS